MFYLLISLIYSIFKQFLKMKVLEEAKFLLVLFKFRKFNLLVLICKYRIYERVHQIYKSQHPEFHHQSN